MALWLLRHGSAENNAVDVARPLTRDGRAEVEAVAAALARLGVRPATILHSGKLRAEQTAEIVATALGMLAQRAEGLGPNDDVEPWAARTAEEHSDLMLVGHLPYLERLASRLVCGDTDTGVLRFAPAAVALLEHRGDWRVEWLLTPRLAGASSPDRAGEMS